MDFQSLLIDAGMIAVAVLLIVVLVRILAAPIKAILKFLLHAGTGILVLFLVNLVGSKFFGFYLEPTNLRLAVAGLGGIPGVILLILVKLLF